jgi:hypothetical protein
VNVSLSGLHVALWLAMILNGIVVFALHRRLVEVRYLLRTIDVPHEKGLPAGTAAPDFDTFLSQSGRRLTHDTLRGRVTALVFLSARCNTCAALIGSLRSAPHDDRLTLFWNGDSRHIPDLGQFDIAISNVAAIARSYRVERFPTAVVIDASGLVRKYAHPGQYEDLIGLLSSSEPTIEADQLAPRNRVRSHHALPEEPPASTLSSREPRHV